MGKEGYVFFFFFVLHQATLTLLWSGVENLIGIAMLVRSVGMEGEVVAECRFRFVYRWGLGRARWRVVISSLWYGRE